MVKAIPDKWLDYKPVGERIEGTRFIAFKLPLKEHVSRSVEMENRLDYRILLSTIPNLGLIIDLTNTSRYYNPEDFRREGVDHKKIMVPGHVTPTRDLTERFTETVKEFMEDNKDNDKLIGVHCTHGVNRTGYFICNYMISQMTVEPTEALNKFANARGHKIERKNYIEALHKLPETRNATWKKREELPKSENVTWRKREELPRSSISNWRIRSEPYNISPRPHTLQRDWRSHNNMPPQRYDDRPSSRYRPPHLRYDYYNPRPVQERERSRHLTRSNYTHNSDHYF